MEPFNFNELPEVVRQLYEKVERIELLLEKLDPHKADKNELLNIEEAAAFLKVSVAAVYTKVSRQEIPYSKPGRRLYFNKTDLKKWIANGKRKTIEELMKSNNHHTTRVKLRPALRRN